MKLWRFQPWGRYNISQATRVAGWSWINWLLSIATLDPTYDFILSQSDMTECQHVKTMTPTGLPFSSREIPSGLGGSTVHYRHYRPGIQCCSFDTSAGSKMHWTRHEAALILWFYLGYWNIRQEMDNQYSYQLTEVIHPFKVIRSGLK